GGGGRVIRVVADRGGRRKIGALAGDRAIGRTGAGRDARDDVVAGPVDGHVGPVPVVAVGGAVRGAADRGRRLVDTNRRRVNGRVACVVHRRARHRLFQTLGSHGLRRRATGDAGTWGAIDQGRI